MKARMLTEMVRQCRACPLGFRGDGVPGEYVGHIPNPDHPLTDTAGHYLELPEVMVIGEAPGRVEQEEGRPFVGDSGQLLRALLEECGVDSYYLTNVVKHRPPVTIGWKGKQEKPNAAAIKACAGFLEAEMEMVRPMKLILLGNVAACRILALPGNTAMKEMVNRVFEQGGDKALVLYHPAYFLHARTAPWVNKALSDFKRSLRNFMGAPIPHYAIEKVDCSTHG